jgi:putative transposase
MPHLETNESSDKSEHSKGEYSARVDRLAKRLRCLNALQLDEVERCVAQLEANDATARIKDGSRDKSLHSMDWPHAPLHRLSGKGTFIVTAGTYLKEHFFRDADQLDYLQTEFLSKAIQYTWHIEAWAIFSNHYHFVGHAVEDAKSLKSFLTHLHADTAREINQRDGVTNRQVWFNFWETELTYEKSYLARLNYVHQNAVRHGLVSVANQYRWCSASWFERTASPSQVKTIYSFKTDKVKVIDDFDVLGVR